MDTYCFDLYQYVICHKPLSSRNKFVLKLIKGGILIPFTGVVLDIKYKTFLYPKKEFKITLILNGPVEQFTSKTKFSRPHLVF